MIRAERLFPSGTALLKRALPAAGIAAALVVVGANLARGGMISWLIAVAAGAIVAVPLAASLGYRTLLFWVLMSAVAYPFVRFPRGTPIVTFDRAVLGGLAVAAILGARRAPRTKQSRRLAAGLTWLAAAYFVGSAASPETVAAVARWFDAIFLSVVAFVIARRVFDTPERCLRLATCLTWTGLVLALLGIGQRLLGYDLATLSGSIERFDIFLNTVRVSGPYPVPEVYGLVLSICLAGTLYWILARGRAVYVRGGAIVALELAGIGLTLFRAAWIGAVLVLIFTVGIRPGRVGRATATVGFVSLVLVIGYLQVQQTSTLAARVNNSENVEGRLATYVLGVEMFRSSPLTGVGVEQFLTKHLEFRPVTVGGVQSVETGHSSYVTVLAEQGIIGFVPLMFVTVAAALMLRRYRRVQGTPDDVLLAHATTGAALSYLVMSLTLTMLPYASSNLFMAIMLGACCARLDALEGSRPAPTGA